MTDNPWQSWLDQTLAKQPKVASKLYRQMIQLYGAGPAGKTCGQCTHCVKTGRNGNYRKCALTKVTHGAATDWRVSWPACGQYKAGEE